MSELICTNCGASAPEGAAFCDNCGAALPAGVCPNCQAPVRPDAHFCDNCGQPLREQPATVVVTYDDLAPDAEAATETSARLLVLPAGHVLPLAPEQDSYVIGRVDPASGSYPEVDLVPFGGEEGGVSRRHAQITRRADRYFIEDLNSVNYTFVNKHKIVVGSVHPLQGGDEIRLGRVLLRFEAG
ncbi:MAG: FHA domain-containing protein [Candidatus Promineofilum sp.]|nr:FHA domain-containing protein [Promineifilum sp.]